MENKNNELAEAVQIITRVDHKLELQVDTLETILKSDELKDHEIVVVSIVGAFRKGKSFLMNFFLKYLYAQYKRHNVNDWIGENSNDSELHGFKWRGGQKPETFGIWMWSEMFTHEFDDGRKVAIILLDTQGIFDHESSLKDCIATFSISMMISSVQCFNVMQNVQEDDLQHLDLFTEYSRLVIEKTQEKPFQNLLFVIRDWCYSYETAYGYSQEFVEKLFNKNDKQTNDMHQLRERIRSSFENIDAFLMPYPGLTVAQKQDFIGHLNEIDSDFVECVKKLVPSILAPKNLIPKKINGQQLCPHDFLAYLEAYVCAFNEAELPEPKTILMATALASNVVLHTKCLQNYTDSMEKHIEQKSLNKRDPYFDQSELQRIHNNAKSESLSQFQGKRKLGSDEMIQRVQMELENNIDEAYASIQREHIRRKELFEEIAKAKLDMVKMKCLKIYIDKMESEFAKILTYFKIHELEELNRKATEISMIEFQINSRCHPPALVTEYQSKLSDAINAKFRLFWLKNRESEEKCDRIIEAVKTVGNIAGSVLLTWGFGRFLRR